MITTFLIHLAGGEGCFLCNSPGATRESPLLLVTLLRATYNWPCAKASGCRHRPTCCRDWPWDLLMVFDEGDRFDLALIDGFDLILEVCGSAKVENFDERNEER